MDFLSPLKSAWKAVTAPNPHAPPADIREMLEEKGYRFAYQVFSTYGYLTPAQQIIAPTGEIIDWYNGKDPASEQYREDFRQALAERAPPGPSLLKRIWDAVTAPHPHYPDGEVRTKLEAKGYKFELNVTGAFGMVSAITRSAYTAGGQRVDYYRGTDAASEQYRRDYKQALAEVRGVSPQ